MEYTAYRYPRISQRVLRSPQRADKGLQSYKMTRQSVSLSWLLQLSVVVLISSYLHYGRLQPCQKSSVSLTSSSRSALYRAVTSIIRSNMRYVRDGSSNVVVSSSRRDDSFFPDNIDRAWEPSTLVADDDLYIQSLNSVQRSIVSADLRNIRVQAGPGSGKTRWVNCWTFLTGTSFDSQWLLSIMQPFCSNVRDVSFTFIIAAWCIIHYLTCVHNWTIEVINLFFHNEPYL